MAKMPGPAVPMERGFQQPRQERMPEIIARRILHHIVNEDLHPGDMLPSETAMIEQLGIGRGTLREALRILEVYGIIRIKPGQRGGPMVDAIDADDYARNLSVWLFISRATYRELLEARMILEPGVARSAATRGSEEARAAVLEAAEANHRAVGSLGSEWLRSSEAFHEAIAVASGNRVISLFSSALLGLNRERLPSTPSEKRALTCKAHDNIANAIAQGDGAKAERLMREHVADFVALVEERIGDELDAVIDRPR